MIATKKQEDF